MRLTTKGRYAVTAMLDLAYHSNQEPVALSEIADRQTISLSYLEQLFASLRKAGIVTGVRGPGGGYRLGREAESISVSDIITAVNEVLDSTRCGGAANCQNNQPCLTHFLWLDLSQQIHQYLSGISLQDLIEQDYVRSVADRQAMQARLDTTFPTRIATGI